MSTPLIAELARLRQADRVRAAAHAQLLRTDAQPSRPVVSVRPALAGVLRRLATQLDGQPASTLVAR